MNENETSRVSGSGVPILRVVDLKQWAYCPRIPYYSWVKPIHPPETEPMRQGRLTQAVIERLEVRRKTSEYSLAGAERLFNVSIVSPALGLSGQIDLVLKLPSEVMPVDFKDTPGPVRRNHGIQLAAYSLLLEERFGVPSTRGFVYLIPSDVIVPGPLGQEAKREVSAMIRDLRDTLSSERLPPPADRRSKCVVCEFLNFCNDRF